MRTKHIILYIPNIDKLKTALQEIHQRLTIKKIEDIRIFSLEKNRPNWPLVDFIHEQEGQLEIFPIHYPTIYHNISSALRSILKFNEPVTAEEKKLINALSTKSARLIYLKIKV